MTYPIDDQIDNQDDQELLPEEDPIIAAHLKAAADYPGLVDPDDIQFLEPLPKRRELPTVFRYVRKDGTIAIYSID